MPSDEFLGDRKKALEESFFARQNELLLEKRRAEKTKLAAKEALQEASQIRDDAVLTRLVDLYDSTDRPAQADPWRAKLDSRWPISRISR